MTRLKLMQSTLMFMIFFSSSLLSQTTINGRMKIDDELINNILNPIWESIPYEQKLEEISLGKVAKGTIAYIESGDISLGTKPNRIAVMEVLNNANSIRVNWQLEDFQISGIMRLEISYKKWGMNFNHIEKLKFNLSEVKKAKSDVSLSVLNNNIKFELLNNKGFQVETVRVSPTEDSSKFLTWIYDKIIKPEKLNEQVKKKINQKLDEMLVENSFSETINKTVSDELNKVLKDKVRLDDISSHLYVKPQSFTINSDYLDFTVGLEFNNDEFTLHPCAQSLSFEQGDRRNDEYDGSISTDIGVVENLILNYMKNSRTNIIGLLEQPISCVGYEDFYEDGSPMGHDISFKLLMRDLKGKIWGRPGKKPIFTYDKETNLTKIDFTFLFHMKGEGFPKVMISEEKPLNIELAFYVGMKANEHGGLNLFIADVDVKNITGDMFVQWFRFTVPVRFPIADNIQELENLIKTEILNNFEDGEVSVLDEAIEVMPGAKAHIKRYQIKNQHDLEFKLVFER